jgi:dTDP-4-dehydrorhamnose reductase
VPATGALLVTGATGYLGPRVLRAGHAVGVEVTGVGSADLDVTDAAAVRTLLDQVRPGAVVHLAAVNPGRGEPARMQQVNGHGAAVVAGACADTGARLVHVSTDVVLGGDPGEAPYPDASPAAPRNRYGVSKAAGEAAVIAADPGAVVVRTSLIYDLDRPDHATAGIARRLAGGEPVTLFTDVWRHPVHAADLAAALVALAVDHRHARGTLNLAGDQALTREASGRRLLAYWKVPGRDRVEAGPVTDPTVPVDLRLRFDAATGLGLRLRGFDQVLGEAGPLRA